MRALGQRGITLLETLVALGVASIVVGLASFLITKPTKLVEGTLSRLIEGQQADLALSELGKQLTSSFVMKSGHFTCTGSAIS